MSYLSPSQKPSNRTTAWCTFLLAAPDASAVQHAAKSVPKDDWPGVIKELITATSDDRLLASLRSASVPVDVTSCILHNVMQSIPPLSAQQIRDIVRWCVDVHSKSKSQHALPDFHLDCAIVLLSNRPDCPMEHPTLAHQWFDHIAQRCRITHKAPNIPSLAQTTSILSLEVFEKRLLNAQWVSSDLVKGRWISELVHLEYTTILSRLPLKTSWSMGEMSDIELPIYSAMCAMSSHDMPASLNAIKTAWPEAFHHVLKSTIKRGAPNDDFLRSADVWSPLLSDMDHQLAVRWISKSKGPTFVPPAMRAREEQSILTASISIDPNPIGKSKRM